MKNFLRIAIASALGLGYCPVASGTAGTLLGVLIHVLIVLYTPASVHLWCFILILMLTCYANYRLAGWARSYWGRKDPKRFVLDEVAGYLVIPVLFRGGELWQVALFGFFFFRFFDVVKPPPAWQVDKHAKGAWGVWVDDLISGLYAVVFMYAWRWTGTHLGIEGWFTL